MDNQYNNDGNKSINSFPLQETKSTKRSVIAKPLKALKRYWYLAVIGLVLISAAIYLILWRQGQESSWRKAQDAYAKADYETAAEALDGISVPSQDDPERLLVYAQTMLATRQLDESLVAYQRLYEENKDPATKINIGNIYNEQKKYDEAAKTFQEVISTNATYTQAYINLATLYKIQGKSDNAVEVARKAVEANPKDIVSNELYVSMLLDRKDTDEYQSAIQSLEDLDPNDALLKSIRQSEIGE